MDQIIRERFNAAILTEAMRRYDIGAADIEDRGGFESFIYRFTRDGEPFILRLTHTFRRTADLIRGEADWINFLAAGGASVARAVPSAGGELVEEIDDGADGRFLATAFAFAPGRPPREVGWTPGLRENYGRLIGRMHALTKRYEPGDPAWRRPSWPANDVAEVERLLPDVDAAAFDRYQAVVRRIEALPRGREDYGLIHFDAHEANFHIDDGGQLTLFDFDDCCYNWFANDIAMVLFYQVTNRDDPAAVAASFLPDFLRGYRAENPFNPAWTAMIADFLTMREILLYAVIMRSYGVTAETAADIPHPWPRRFMEGRRERIAAEVPYVEIDMPELVARVS